MQLEIARQAQCAGRDEDDRVVGAAESGRPGDRRVAFDDEKSLAGVDRGAEPAVRSRSRNRPGARRAAPPTPRVPCRRCARRSGRRTARAARRRRRRAMHRAKRLGARRCEAPWRRCGRPREPRARRLRRRCCARRARWRRRRHRRARSARRPARREAPAASPTQLRAGPSLRRPNRCLPRRSHRQRFACSRSPARVRRRRVSTPRARRRMPAPWRCWRTRAGRADRLLDSGRSSRWRFARRRPARAPACRRPSRCAARDRPTGRRSEPGARETRPPPRRHSAGNRRRSGTDR